MRKMIMLIVMAAVLAGCPQATEEPVGPLEGDVTGIYTGTARGTVAGVPVILSLVVELDEMVDLGWISGAWSAGAYSGHISGGTAVIEHVGSVTTMSDLFIVMTTPCWASSTSTVWTVNGDHLTGRFDSDWPCVGDVALAFDGSR